MQGTSNGQHTVVNTRDHLAHTSLDTSLVAQVSDILTGLADNNTRFLGGDDGAKSQHGLGIFFFGLGSDLDVTLVDKIVHGLVDDGGSLVDVGVHFVERIEANFLFFCKEIYFL